MTSLTITRAYQQFFETHPNGTLALTGGILNAVGDIVAQVSQNTLSEDQQRRPGWDTARTLRFFCFGFGISPLLGRWNVVLERRFPLCRRRSHKVNFSALSKRVAADQLLMAPFGLVLFIGCMGAMEGRDLVQIRERYSDMYTTALLANWKVWPMAQLVNFRYMPLPYRIPFQSTCGVFWTLYLSLLNAKEDKKQEHKIAIHRTQ
ncbi:hypothetical protein EDD16DRAFT_17682 [Pisolithus croceorrhizus]|nr:hypothetical protein EDD16DRAFT_17682 [Pisolithus croceorrhizus]KAI6134121.1 hypothetical protein EV401DRAFT_1444650 [Pisolithus croceorrhizus]KAI6159563.1 hypothetical protein EDD17DRAFT_1762318 [Pisolithus thermaeus]